MKLRELKSIVGGKVVVRNSNMTIVVELNRFNDIFILRPDVLDCEIEGFYPHLDFTWLQNHPDSPYAYGIVYTEIVIEREV